MHPPATHLQIRQTSSREIQAAYGDKCASLTSTSHNASTPETSTVIGCDGINSHIRLILLGHHHPAAHAQFTSKYAYRSLILSNKAVTLLGDELARNSQMYMGYGGHVLTFPIESGDVMNVVTFQTKRGRGWDDESWHIPMRKKDIGSGFWGVGG